MTRLPLALQHLYLPREASDPQSQQDSAALADHQGRVRALLLELAGPADWVALSAVWQGVQRDLGLPAPAIAVSGHQGLQLWFSLAEARPAEQASRFLAGLCTRYLGDVDARRLRRWPEGGLVAPPGPALPPRLVAAERWSAFVAPDLAPMFAEEPWLDLPPNMEGQARLLAGLGSIRAVELDQAVQALTGSRLPSPEAPASTPPGPGAVVPLCDAADDPRRFLVGVMNNESVPWAQRIEAAKALLPGAAGG